MATGKQLKAAILARRAAKGPRKKRTRQEPRQYTVADLERARDRVAAAERRIDNDRKAIPTGDARGWSGRSSNCPSSSRNYACAASLSDGSIELFRQPGEHVEGPRSRLDVWDSIVDDIAGAGCCRGEVFSRHNCGRCRRECRST